MADSTVKIFRGNDTPVVWRFKNADKTVFDLTGSDFILRVKYQESTVLIDSTSNTAGLQVNGALGEVTWNPSTEDTLRFKDGRPSPYELDRIIDGRTRTLVEGDFVGVGKIDS
jgi:hypothetical protein